MRKLLNLISYLTIFSAIGLITLVVVWMTFPYKTITFVSPTFKILTPTVKQGQLVKFVNNSCKHINLPATTTRIFQNDLIYYLPETKTDAPVGCHNDIISVKIPDELPPGHYFIKNMYQYQVNPIRTISITHDTEDFLVIE